MEQSTVNRKLLSKHLQELITRIGHIGALHDEALDKFTKRQMTSLIIELRKEISWNEHELAATKQTNKKDTTQVTGYEMGEKFEEA